jgi:hypothetical protein
MDDNKTAKGSARGTSVALKYAINLMMIGPSIPLPTKSSIQSQKNWSIKTNRVIKNVAINGPMNDRSISISSFLINVLRSYVIVSLEMDRAKIQLSPEELELVQNAEWLLTKNRIIEKVYGMFGLLIDDIKELSQRQPILFSEMFTISPKISKGENYLGLPYVMLDYPRYFGKTDTIAIRTMFWWGNFFSVTLHLKGKYKEALLPSFKTYLPVLADHHFFVSINKDEWRHDFLPDNYREVSRDEATAFDDKLLGGEEFCKIAAKISLHDWSNVPAKLTRLYDVLFKYCIVSYQGDERGL